MSTHDIHGRPWAKLSELKEGDKVQLDGSFTCMVKDDIFHVKRSAQEEGVLFLQCKDSHHYLVAQADDGEHCIGVYHVK